MPFGTLLRLSYKGKQVDARVTDTGGFEKYDRQMDVSRAVAKQLGFIDKGTAKIGVRVLYAPAKPIMGIACAKTDAGARKRNKTNS